MTARLSPCGGFVEIEGRLWRDRFPVARLDPWRAFYRRLATRKGAPDPRPYRDTLAALDAVAAQLTGETTA